MTTTTTSSSRRSRTTPPPTNTLPPVVHAVGGCVGSVLSLFLLYPLERARIEMQAAVGHNSDEATAHDAENTTDYQRNKENANSLMTKFSSSEENDSWCTDDDILDPDADQHAQAATMESSACNKDESLYQCLYRLWQRGQLYQGLLPILTAVGISNFVFFGIHEWVKAQLRVVATAPQSSLPHPPLGRYTSLLASCLAGVGNVCLTNPVWLIAVRLSAGRTAVASRTNSFGREFQWIVQHDGVRHLWTGVSSSLWLVSNPVLQFVVYEQIKQWQTEKGTHLSPVRAFGTGALAKAVSTILTYPLQLTQTVMRLEQRQRHDCDTSCGVGVAARADDEDVEQEHGVVTQGQQHVPSSSSSSPLPQHRHHLAVWDCLVHLYHTQGGWRGLYTGMQAKLIQTVLTAAFTFLTYEQILQAVAVAHLTWSSRQHRRKINVR